jgi:Rps23 Pro-64 3,4-dihydroxylase Tpa1-like proline 4-hydroxylase
MTTSRRSARAAARTLFGVVARAAEAKSGVVKRMESGSRRLRRPGRRLVGNVSAVDDGIVLAVELREFLSVSEMDTLRGFARENESRFRPSTIYLPADGQESVDENIRCSAQLDRRSDPPAGFGDVEAIVRKRVSDALPCVLAELNLPPHEPTSIDFQITASNHRGHFNRHVDADPKSSRKLSYVYFFHQEPAAFRGGDLKIYPTENTIVAPGTRCGIVHPEQNKAAFFRSTLLHEVTPIDCETEQFCDGRFTANGWIHW